MGGFGILSALKVIPVVIYSGFRKAMKIDRYAPDTNSLLYDIIENAKYDV